MEKGQIVRLHKNFEDCAHEKDGTEFWYARELQTLLGYDRWENFENAINKAKIACQNAKQPVNDRFVDVNKTIPMPKWASKDMEEDTKKLQWRIKSEDKKLPKTVRKLKE